MTLVMPTLCAITLLAVAVPSALANEPFEDVPNCYDAVVTARIVKQIPSVAPECGEDCIITVWPWFLDLEVRRSLIGDVPRGRLQVMGMLHTSYRRDLGHRRWWLRRNGLGGYNLLRFGAEGSPALCAKDSGPAKAYIMPGAGKTLDDLRTEGERAYRAYE
jgi:hypothetical protein